MSVRMTNNFPRAARGLRPKARRVVETTAHQIVSRAKAAMASPKTGRWYGNHQASAPGEAPAVDTSNLINSGKVEMESETVAIVSFTAESGDGYPYSIELEFGTAQRAPRPYLTPAVEGERAAFNRAMADIFKP